MFNSFFESAKDTIRRVGALDGSTRMKDDGIKAGVASVPADPDRDSAMKGDRFTPRTEPEVGARERKEDSASTTTATTAGSAASSSLSRSFSRLKASGVTSVSKVNKQTRERMRPRAIFNYTRPGVVVQEPLQIIKFLTKSFRLAD